MQTYTKLISLEVRWTISSPSENLIAAIPLSETMMHAMALSDDEFDRMRVEDIEIVKRARHIDHAVKPIITALASQSLNTKDEFRGDVDQAVAAFSTTVIDDADPDDLWFNILHDSIFKARFLLPLNVEHSGAIALGFKLDNPRSINIIEEHDNFEALHNIIQQNSNYGFIAETKLEEGIWF